MAGERFSGDRSGYHFTGNIPVYLQDTVITGKVTDENGAPIAGANILEKGSTNGVISDSSGNFSIKVANARSQTIRLLVGISEKRDSCW